MKKQESSRGSQLGIIHDNADVEANLLKKQFMFNFTKEDTANILDKGPAWIRSLINRWATSNQTRPLDNMWFRRGLWSSCQRKFLQPMFQLSLYSEQVLRDWPIVHHVPNFKNKGDQSAAFKYRPALLTLSLGAHSTVQTNIGVRLNSVGSSRNQTNPKSRVGLTPNRTLFLW